MNGRTGMRGVVWVRLRERATGKVFFAASHHGPLPVNTGGAEGGAVVAEKIQAVISNNAGADDVVMLGGDFNADDGTATVAELDAAFTRVRSDWVDHLYIGK